MTSLADLLLLLLILLDLSVVATGRLTTCVRLCAAQGILLAALVLLFAAHSPEGLSGHALFMAAGTIALKAVAIPLLLLGAIREADVDREVEPFVSLHLSVLLAAALVGLSFWLARGLALPHPPPAPLLVPAAFATLLLGFLVLVNRHKAISQAIGYLLIDNGISAFGLVLARELPFAVELVILLDLLAAVFVMGIAINHISREFDHIDAAELRSLRD